MDLSNILGGAGGVDVGRLATAVQDVFESKGGVEGLTNQLRAGGLGGAVDSWISTGPNQSVEPQQLGSGAGPGHGEPAGRSSRASTWRRCCPLLASLLPQIIDFLTPGGQLPADGGVGSMGGIGDVIGSVLGGAGAARSGGLGGLAGSLGGLLGGSDRRRADALLEQALDDGHDPLDPAGVLLAARVEAVPGHQRAVGTRPPTRCRRCRRTRSRAPPRALAGSRCSRRCRRARCVRVAVVRACRGDGVVRRRDDDHATGGHEIQDGVEDRGRVGTERRRPGRPARHR